ncbi:hypothetical protein ACJIZ3_013759 [Penstemon smallii]|uniref:Uncharacterized protein n=1 Tax=Penstemon smallii TaxID=265156 RepID=A0ABD3RL38_9LAMI
MADVSNMNSVAPPQPSRLKRKAPTSIQINTAAEWKVAIPLLSPLVQSPTDRNLTAEIRSFCANGKNELAAAEEAETKTVVVMKKWQHPAAPFCYEPAPYMSSFCTGSLER